VNKPVSEILEKVAQSSPHWAEFRYHRRESQNVQVQKGMVKQLRSLINCGVGIRTLVDGAWGFSSTSDTSERGIQKALKLAIECAKGLSQMKKASVKKLPAVRLARGEFVLEGYQTLRNMTLEEKLSHVIKTEAQTRNGSTSIQSATCGYSEMFEDKVVVTTDGANARSQLARNEIRVAAVAAEDGQMAEGHRNIGSTGHWDCLFLHESLGHLSETAVQMAVELLHAPRVPGGVSSLILSPAMVGLLSHEAIGHTVEADFVLSGSVAAGKLGQQVASPLVTLSDSGQVPGWSNGGGDLLVDDEGVPVQRTAVIEKGILKSYLHNRESAAHFGVSPTGNARAWLYNDEPLIRMRNTYIEPGQTPLEKIIESTEEGYLLDGAMGGQADATGEFMFGAQKVQRIKNGKLGEVFRGATISGKAFEVLSSVDAVSKEFQLDLGSGYCGKGQPAKVDAGGPYIRCRATVGGKQ
jgi:TldD protein